jgi:hypothetical protein
MLDTPLLLMRGSDSHMQHKSESFFTYRPVFAGSRQILSFPSCQSFYRLQLLQALMALAAFNSSSLRLRFIFLSLASLMTSLSSFLALPFWSSLFCFCLGLGFCQPYHHLRARVSISRTVRAASYMLFDAFFVISPRIGSTH